MAVEPVPRPSLCWGGGGGFPSWLTRQGEVEAATRGGADAYLLAQQFDGCLAPTDSLRTSARVCLADILSVDEALCNLGKFAFVALHLFSTGRRHLSDVTELLCLIERLEELHIKVQEMISSPQLSMKLIYNVSRRWSL